MRRFAIAAAGLALLVGLVFGLVLAVAHGLAREALRETLEAQLGESLGVALRIERLGGVLYREIEIEGLTLGDPEGDDRSAFRIDRAALTWKGRESLRVDDPSGVPAIFASSLSFDGVRLRIVSGQPLPWEGPAAEREENETPTAQPLLSLDALTAEALEVEVVGRDGARLLFEGRLEAADLRSGHGELRVKSAALAGMTRTARDAGSALRELAALELGGGLDFAAADSSPPASTAPGGSTGTEAATDGRLGWRVDRLRVDGATVRATGSGSGDATGLDAATIDFEIASLSALLEELAAFDRLEEGVAAASVRGGAARGSLALRGPWEGLSGAASLAADRLVVAETSLGDLRLRTRAEAPGVLTIDELELQGGALTLRAAPGASLAREKGALALRAWAIEIGASPPSAVDAAQHLSAMQATGNESTTPGRLRIEGTLPLAAGDLASAGRDPMLGVDIALERLALNELLTLAPGAREALDRVVRFDAPVLDAELRIGGEPTTGLTLDGWFKASAAALSAAEDASSLSAEGVELRVDLSGPIERSTGRLLGSVERVVDGRRARGRLDLDASFVTHLGSDVPSADLRVATLAWSGDPVPLRIVPGGRLRIAPDEVRLRDVAIESGEQRMRAEGRVVRAADGGAVFRGLAVEVEALSLGWLRERLHDAGLLGPDVSVGGALAGSARLEGPIALPSLEADLVIESFSSAGIGFDLVRFEARSPGSSVALRSQWRREERDVLRFDLAASRAVLFRDPLSLFETPNTRLSLRADRFDLSVFDAFAPASVEALRGSLDADVSIIGGSPAQVERGTFELRDGYAQLASPRQRVGPISAVGRLSTGTIEIDRVTIGPPAAQILANGRVEELGSGDERLSGELRFAAYPFKVTGIAKARLDGGLQLGGRVSAPTVGGKLVLSDVELWLPDSNAPELKEILVYAEGTQGDGLSIEEGEPESGIADRIAADVAVELKRGSWARGRGVEAELSGDLRLQKPAGGRESYSGSIRTVRGTYEVYGRRFQIERGLATLDGSARIDPVLDIVGKYRIRSVEIDARIGGRLSDPTLVFESSPELSQTDIASYLLLGRPAATASGDDAIAVQVTAARLATGLVSSELDRLLAPILPVDVIDVRLDSRDEEDAFALGVGKYIGERLFIRYDRRFGREVVDEFRAEYELTPRISVESSAATNGEAGGDVIFNLEY